MKLHTRFFPVLGLFLVLLGTGEALGDDPTPEAAQGSFVTAEVAYHAGLAAEEAGDHVLARAKFQEALQVHPGFSSAQRKLDEVQVVLIQKARTVYAQASTMERANQHERAAILFQEVMRMVEDPGNDLYQRAQAKRVSLSRE